MKETDRDDLLNKLYKKIEGIDEKIDSHNLYVEKELGRRPTRAELYTMLTMIVAGVGLAVAIV